MRTPRPQIAARLAARLRRRLGAPRAAANSLADPEVAKARALVYFADGPNHLYQLEQWFAPLEELNRAIPTAIIVGNFETYRRLTVRPGGGTTRRRGDAVGSGTGFPTTLPVGFATSRTDIETTIGAPNTAVVLYPNNNAANFRCLRYGGPVHIFIGHGESDKASSSSNQLRAYDYTLAAGPASKDRMRSIRFFDADERVVAIGRPQLDSGEPPAPPATVARWKDDGRPVVLYAPTWEGDRPSMAYGSVRTHGRRLVESILADGGFHLLFRPHPSSGTRSPAYGRAVADLARLIERAGSGHAVDRSTFGWQIDFADYLLTDVSAVAYDWLGSSKPMLITLPESEQVHREESELLHAVPAIDVSDAGDAPAALRGADIQRDPASEIGRSLARLRTEYFGDQTPGAATRRFVDAVVRLGYTHNR